MADKNLLEAYVLLRRETPFGFDCGRLCGARCCKGDENTGMTLFHGERALLEGVGGFEIRNSGGDDILVCSGVCDRRTRPLACRFFPFYPLIREDCGRISFHVVYDIRGLSSCPATYGRLKPDYTFARAVRKAAMWLARDGENLRIFRDTAALFDEISNLNDRLSKG